MALFLQMLTNMAFGFSLSKTKFMSDNFGPLMQNSKTKE